MQQDCVSCTSECSCREYSYSYVKTFVIIVVECTSGEFIHVCNNSFFTSVVSSCVVKCYFCYIIRRISYKIYLKFVTNLRYKVQMCLITVQKGIVSISDTPNLVFFFSQSNLLYQLSVTMCEGAQKEDIFFCKIFFL